MTGILAFSFTLGGVRAETVGAGEQFELTGPLAGRTLSRTTIPDAWVPAHVQV